jgi:hypothetical protein
MAVKAICIAIECTLYAPKQRSTDKPADNDVDDAEWNANCEDISLDPFSKHLH